MLCFLIITVACWLNYFTVFKLWPSSHSFSTAALYLFFLFAVFFFAGYLFTTEGAKTKFSNANLCLIVAAAELFALKVTLPYEVFFLQQANPATQLVFHQPAAWAGGLMFMLAALLVLHLLTEKKAGLFFIKITVNYKVYVLLLLLMIPLLLFAAVQPAFQQVYPKVSVLSSLSGIHTKPLHYVLFELSYMLDFVTIELFFRGMLIALLSRTLGVHCIVPVALFYFSIHLGKPMLEAISSFFGGLILGAVSYETKSIWGGWMVHCGIALLMELFGFIFR